MHTYIAPSFRDIVIMLEYRGAVELVTFWVTNNPRAPF